jgi:hypothetical protein
VRGGGSDKAPSHDAASTGRLTLCDRSGQRVRSGSVTAKPVIWRAVGATKAGSLYDVAGRTATLYAYQPRAGVDPTQWSGQELTAAARYQTDHGIAQATRADVALKSFLTAFPAQDHGFVQLRLYLGAPNQPQSTEHYDSVDLKVSGSSWKAVDPGQGSCAGDSVSVETLTGVAGSN